MQEELNTIKSVTQLDCPHCKKELLVSAALHMPTIELLRKEDMAEAKEELLKEIESLNLDEGVNNDILKWVEDETTIIFKADIPEIIKNLKK